MAQHLKATSASATTTTILFLLLQLLHHMPSARALDNGLARTPPMGFNSYMSGLHGEAGLGAIADFFVSSGMRELGYIYVNTDEGWELKNRTSEGGVLQVNPAEYPSGLLNFTTRLRQMGLKYGIYGAASGVTCGDNPGQLYHEDTDAQWYVAHGVSYLKSDNCASYALDSSVRFGAMADALNRTGTPVVLSIEPFSIAPDPAQSVDVANLARVFMDIRGKESVFLDRADHSDKWAPLAQPGYFNDPDMINLQAQQSAGWNRLYFGLWAIMKSPLLLSANLPKLPASLIAMAKNKQLIAINQDPLAVQARKLAVNGSPLPWLIGLEDCSRTPNRFYNRGLDANLARADTRTWTVEKLTDSGGGGGASLYQLKNRATNRCLSSLATANSSGGTGNGTTAFTIDVVLLPCDAMQTAQQWNFDKGANTVTSITNVKAGMALAVRNSSLYATVHKPDTVPVPDAAYGQQGLTLVTPYNQESCDSRSCENYDNTQMWYYAPRTGLLKQSSFVASVNHFNPAVGQGYRLTDKMPTWRHHCLAHVLSAGNEGTQAGQTEVWGGPLAGGDYVMALVNRAVVPADANALTAASKISARFSMMGLPGLGDDTALGVTELFSGQDLGIMTGGFSDTVSASDIRIYRLTKQKK
eukprot:UC1_evm1s1876